MGVVIGDFLQLFPRDDVAEELIDGEAEVGLRTILCSNNAVKTFDECFGRDVLVPVKRAKINN